MIEAEILIMPNCILGEGCVWNRNEHALYFVDIDGQRVCRLKPQEKTAEAICTDGRPGCLVFDREGGMLTAETNCLVYRAAGKDKGVVRLRQDFPDYLRYNDGKCDRYGNLWVGTMALSQGHPNAKGGGSLYCIREDHVVAEYGGYTIPNGLAWNRDGSVFYHTDTALQEISAYDVEDEIRLVNRRRALRIAPEEGSPDGMCMDAEGNLWIAMWGGGKVNCYHLPTGEKLEEIRVPDRYVSCCCFGGEDGKNLYITTARGEDGTGGQIYQTRLQAGGSEGYRYGR